MGVRKLLVMMLVCFALQTGGTAATYKVPVTATASLAMDASYYPAELVENVPYDFSANPSVLRVGYDAATNKVYDSALYLDWSSLGFIPEGTPLALTFCWAPIAAADGNPAYFQCFSAIHLLGPQPLDFDWWALTYSNGLDPLQQPDRIPTMVWDWPRPASVGGVLLLGYQQAALTQIAGVGYGQGYEAPYVLVTTVPEPSGWLALGLLTTGALCLAACRRSRGLAVVSAVVLALALAPAFADEVGSDAGEVVAPSGLMAAQSAVALPYGDGSVILPTFPRLFWSYGCVPTVGAMICGYYDNSGFPDMYKDVNGAAAVFPTGTWPSDNAIFLKTYPDGTKDSVDMYPSRCVLSATEKGVLGRTENGHVDDYWYNSQPALYGPFGNLQNLNEHCPYGLLTSTYDAYCNINGSDKNPVVTPHADDCLADFMGTSIRFWRNNSSDGNSTLYWTPLGSQVTWTPPYYPYPNNIVGKTNNQLDSLFGFTRYIAEKAQYHPNMVVNTIDKDGHASWYYDLERFYAQTIAGYGGVQSGATMQDVVTEIDAGRPLFGVLFRIDSGHWTTYGHAIAIFGYRKVMTEGQWTGLDLLTYDTWHQDSDGQHTAYSIVPFPDPTVANNPAYTSLSRTRVPCSGNRYTEYWKLYALCFVQINDHGRCLPPTLSADSGTYANPFELTVSDSTTPHCTHVRYDGKDPTPDSPYVELNTSTGEGTSTIHIDGNCTLKFRTYHDVSAPDGYVASSEVERTYEVTSPNLNLKSYADGTHVGTGPFVVTAGTDVFGLNGSQRFCYVEDQNRLRGIRLQVSVSTNVNVGDLVSVTGTLSTNSAGERVLCPGAVNVIGSTAPILPLGMTNRSLGGANLNYNSTTGEGQRGITGGVGLNNVGLLVKTTGCVYSYDTSSFQITDGSPNPTTVITPATVTPPQSGYVTVTGISSLQSDGNGGYQPVLLVRNSDDIVTYEECETCGNSMRPNAPAIPMPEEPEVLATDTVAWALDQSDNTTVTVKACSVTSCSSSGLAITDGWGTFPSILVPGNWAVDEWATVDVTGVLTTLPDGTRAITATQVLVYTDSNGRPFTFPMPWRNGRTGQLFEEWPYKQAASRLLM